MKENNQERRKEQTFHGIDWINQRYFLTQDKRVFLWVIFDFHHLFFFALGVNTWTFDPLYSFLSTMPFAVVIQIVLRDYARTFAYLFTGKCAID